MSIDVKNFISKHEGRRPRVYPDTRGILTIGVGCNLQRADARQRLTAVGADYDAVLLGKADLTEAQIDALLQEDIDACGVQLHKLLPDFDTYPDLVTTVCYDLCFNMGLAKLESFHNTLACIRNRDWKGAADNLRQSLWAKQVGHRAIDDIQLLLDADAT